ncbi:MAG TPA: hypothetical protein VGK20_06550 [Candidatus Binatia bacterium]|jgi:hypothetical protein
MRRLISVTTCLLAALLASPARAGDDSLLRQTDAEAAAKSEGCLTCHTGIEPMHESSQVNLGCIDCHGGNVAVHASGLAPKSAEYLAAMKQAHVQPRYPKEWSDPKDPSRISSANPERSYTLLNRESAEYIRFRNPGDLRVADKTCGSCHAEDVDHVHKSLMSTTAMLWGGAAYNNGIAPLKPYIFGESYGADGVGQKISTQSPPSDAEAARGALPSLVPLPRWNVVDPPDPLRAFERGGRIDRSNVAEVGNPGLGPFLDEPGLPDMKLGTRGPGTDLRVSAGVLNLQKTRLNDPLLSFLGTNDHPGDFRSSGCTACHVVYANDRDRVHSGAYAADGHTGTYHGNDPTIPREESGHPIQHRLTRAVPSSQCMVCHMHQPNSFVNTFFGYQMWDYETDGDLMWPKQQRYPTVAAPTPMDARHWQPMHDSLARDPEEAAVRGLWNNEDFLRNVSSLPTKETRFADYNGHGWIFRAVYWQDRKGNLLDAKGKPIDWNSPDKLQHAVQLMDIHAEKGMHCVDCHFRQDNHSDGNIYGAYPDAVEIGCIDCHGNTTHRASLETSGPAAPGGGHPLENGITPSGKRRFEWVYDEKTSSNRLMQRSMLDKDVEWEVKQVVDTIDPNNKRLYNEKARYAKTMRMDGAWGAFPEDTKALAHGDDNMACASCHTSWVTSCFGCHLPQQADWKKDSQHFEGGQSRNWSSYDPQVLRNDIFMLGRHSTSKGHVIAPVRSSSAVMISSTNANRERIYGQQMPISGEGYSSQAFNTHFAHTVRTTQTQQCSSCHLSTAGDNNAWLTQVMTLGTNFVNFVGRFAWIGEEKGIEAVGVTEWDEPQAVIGSRLHRLAYPAEYDKHVANDSQLKESYEHAAGHVQCLQLRGEYLYTANGGDGLRIFDVANVDNKGFSERITTAPVSPLGQRTYVKTRNATCVALPTTMPIHFDKPHDPANQEQPMHPLYRYAYLSDSVEGLVVVDVDTLTDGDPQNNFLERAATFNPDGILDGASYLTIAGSYAYMLTPRGVVTVSIDDPLHPRVVSALELPGARSIAIQLRYAFVTAPRGLEVVDITSVEHPRLAASLDLAEAGEVYVARTYAYVPAGSQGLAIVDIEKPEHPFLQQMFNADGKMNDVRAVRIGATGASVFAYVADGKNGLHVLQLIAPNETPGDSGFSPTPTPRLIASYRTKEPALALSKGIDRDRAVDESGNQVSVFGRLGSRPFTRAEMDTLLLRNGKPYLVSDKPATRPRAFVLPDSLVAKPPGEEEAAPPGTPVVQPAAAFEERILPGRN